MIVGGRMQQIYSARIQPRPDGGRHPELASLIAASLAKSRFGGACVRAGRRGLTICSSLSRVPPSFAGCVVSRSIATPRRWRPDCLRAELAAAVGGAP